MPPRSVVSHRWPTSLAVIVAIVVSGCSGGSTDDDQTPDEASFCKLALASEPVAEASAVVLRRLGELASDEIDAAVVVLREGAEELEGLAPHSPEAIALEFEIRFRQDYIEARNAVESYVDAQCREAGHVETSNPGLEP